MWDYGKKMTTFEPESGALARHQIYWGNAFGPASLQKCEK